MTFLSTGMALVRQWLPAGMPEGLGGARPHEPLAIELHGTLGIARAEGDRIEASIAGRIRPLDPNEALGRARDVDGHGRLMFDRDSIRAETWVEARRRSLGALAEANPFVWFQLFDDRGTALAPEMFLGHGIAIEYEVHARIEVPTIVEPSTEMGSRRPPGAARPNPLCSRLASGVHARVVTRTYRNSSGPRYHIEVLVLRLLAAGAQLLVPAVPMMPALARVPGRSGVPMRVALLETRPA